MPNHKPGKRRPAVVESNFFEKMMEERNRANNLVKKLDKANLKNQELQRLLDDARDRLREANAQ